MHDEYWDEVDQIKSEFHLAAAEWRERTMFVSSVSQLSDDPAMRRIVELGRLAVPLLLIELRTNPDQLCIALHEITGENPVPEEHYGHLPEIAKAWLQWGDENAYLEEYRP